MVYPKPLFIGIGVLLALSIFMVGVAAFFKAWKGPSRAPPSTRIQPSYRDVKPGMGVSTRPTFTP